MCGCAARASTRNWSRSAEHYPDALVQHSQSVTDYIDTLADILCETAVQIRGDAETLGGCHVPPVIGAERFPRKRSGANIKPL